MTETDFWACRVCRSINIQAIALLIGLYLIWRVERLVRARAE